MSTPRLTQQYQSYGGTSARSDGSPAAAVTDIAVFKVPDSPATRIANRKRRVKVLDEDDYVEKVEKIIERDFFPELDKLKAQSEYIEAKDRNDYATMSRLQEKYSGCRPNTGRLASPATFETPQDLPRETDPRRPAGRSSAAEELTDDSPISSEETNPLDWIGGLAGKEENEPLRLDKFLANHTSEDNESFIEIQDEAEKKHRIKNSWMYKDEVVHLENKARSMELPSIEMQNDLYVRPLDVETWTYQNINSVFHNIDSLELTDEQKLEAAKKKKEIKHGNTRLTKTPWKTEKQMEQMRREAEKQKAVEAGKVGIDGKELGRPETPSVNGFKLMSMAPSPMVGVEDSPLMTWGQVETTPYRLEGAETPLLTGGGGGGGFCIKEVGQRDRLAKELADKNAKFYRDKKSKAIAQAKSSLKGGRARTAGITGMSPAAQRLASGKLGIRLGTDQMLKSSYTPSPARKGAGTPTPRQAKGTPTPTRAKTGSKVTSSMGVRTKTPVSDITDNLLDIGGSRVNNSKVNLTDNLLNLGNNRTRASEFFQKPKD